MVLLVLELIFLQLGLRHLCEIILFNFVFCFFFFQKYPQILEFLVALSKLFANLAVRLLLGQAEYGLLILFISRICFIKISLKILVFFTALDQLITHLANF